MDKSYLYAPKLKVMSKPVRVRFAPSPTGPLHLGGVRTALYNYLFAKKHNGTFIIRIEDTDEKRYVPGAKEYVFDALKWAGISPTEGPGLAGEKGPYIQTERKHLYKPYADQLIESGDAYYAFDTSADLENMREQAKKMGLPNWQYSAITRSNMKNSVSLSKEEVQSRLDNGDPYTIRMKMPRNHDIKFEDAIRGWVTVNTNNLDDKVLFKESGMPTYHLANIVDDHLMEISHVIRGEEWLPSAPLHVLLYKAFGWDAPVFAHLPLILRPDGNGKLSKRDGDRLGFPVFPLDWMSADNEKFTGYKEQGYFPAAFVNMLAFLGWNPGTNQEIFSLEELVEAFSLERVGKSGARFDPDKTKWFNQQYLRTTDDNTLTQLLKPYLAETNIEATDEYIAKVCGVMKERATFIPDLLEESRFFFEDVKEYDEKTVRKKWKEDTDGYLTDLNTELEGLPEFTHDNVEQAFQNTLAKHEIGFGKLGPALRLVVTGKAAGPSLFDICSILGKETVLGRISLGLTKFAI